MNIAELKKQRRKLSVRCTKDGHRCSRADGAYCGTYAFPAIKWRLGDCPMADKELRTVVESASGKSKVRVGQQKQKKKGRR